MGNRILVVDDNHDIVNIVESWLKANDYEVYTAYSGEEGLEKSKSLKPDAVILDIERSSRNERKSGHRSDPHHLPYGRC